MIAGVALGLFGIKPRDHVPTGGTFFVMPRGSSTPAQQESAWAFARWMLEPEQNVYWARETGYLPTTWAAVSALEREGHFERQPNARVALKQLEVATPWPWSAQLFRVQREVVQPLLEDAVLARRDASVTLARAREAAARLI